LLFFVLLSHGNGAQHQRTANQCRYKCFHLIMLVGFFSVFIRGSVRDCVSDAELKTSDYGHKGNNGN
jgi:hypothetical protein